MDIGHFSDKGIPVNNNAEGMKVNSLGYRCPEFTPLPDGKKNVVYLDVHILLELVIQKKHIG